MTWTGVPVNGSIEVGPVVFSDGSSRRTGMVVAVGGSGSDDGGAADVDATRKSEVSDSRLGASRRGVEFSFGVSSFAVRLPGSMGRSGGRERSESQNTRSGRRLSTAGGISGGN